MLYTIDIGTEKKLEHHYPPPLSVSHISIQNLLTLLQGYIFSQRGGGIKQKIYTPALFLIMYFRGL